MRTKILMAMGLVALGAGCSPPAERCGEEICTATQRCTAEKKCVTDETPTITLEAPIEMNFVSIDTVEVKGKATDDEKPPIVELSGNGTTFVPVKLNDDGTFTQVLTLPKVDGSSATVTARARDSKKQEAKVTRILKVDNTAPTCILDAPLDMTTTNQTGTLKATMHAADGSLALENPRISTDDGATFTPLSTATPGTYEHLWTLPIENGVQHVVVFRVDDMYGHTCEAKASVFIDNVKPTVAFTTPAAGSLLGPGFFTAATKIGGTAGDGMRLLKSVTLDFADGAGPRPASVVGVNWSLSVPAPAADDYKTHVATVLATDLANNTATATLSVIVDVKPPVLTFTAPAANAKLNVTSFTTSNNAPLAWTLTDGDPTLNLGLVLTDGGFVSPPVLPTSATDNPKTYAPVLRANDRAGNTTTATVTFTVDRVLPTVTAFFPANDTRMYGGNIAADFSEPMTFGAGLATNPNLPGSWSTPQHFEIANLAEDTIYTVTTGLTVTDLHGNQVVPINYRLHTETAVPASGASLGTGYVEVLDAQADAEGVLNVTARRLVSGDVDWVQVNARTGVASVIDTLSGAGVVGNLVAARSVQPDLTSRRLAGLWFNDGAATNLVRYNVNGGGPQTIAGAQAFIPTPGFPGEGSTVGDFGYFQGGAYKRSGRADVATGLPDVDRVSVTDTRWELVRHVGGGTQSMGFGCVAGCAVTAVKTLGGGGSGIPNSAASKSCSIHGYLNGVNEMTTMFRYQPGCGGTMNPCAPDISEADNFDQVVPDPAADGTFYGYSTVGVGVFQIKKRVLSAANCSGAVTNVGAPITLGALQGQPRLVVVRGTPGLIFADPNRLLRFIGP